ncbi:SDR family NAD(P)-dependent oxidoreductase [Nonomuraea basaltis]|uniref:SDR family NAD(P)-dependent oxidoreductase n=1 Tax=Nonomuraea basaltis TaxID=2495887 RepID=UPI00110C3F2C|nr:SDR family oxidoreductase [Nonomuraea basaltis]TMR91119.1 SDR family oxidoreductase [Nonomuraea basaltis]
MSLNDKTAVIYGAAGAIGGEVARTFAREGARVYLAGRTLATLDTLAKEINAAGGQARTAEVDALDHQAVVEHADAVAGEAGGIDVSFNAIGFDHSEFGIPLVELTYEAFAVPLVAYTRTHFITATAAARHMTARGSGVILTLSSTAARLTAYPSGGFGTACAAVERLSLQLAAELGPQGVRVVCLRPAGMPETARRGSHSRELWSRTAVRMGMTPEQMLDAPAPDSVPLRRAPRLAEVAEAAAFLASDLAGAMTSTVVNLSCGEVAD